MFEDLVAMLTRLDHDGSSTRAALEVLNAGRDVERVDVLTALERIKAVCAAIQVRVTVELAQSQEQVAAAWRARAEQCSGEGDFDGWVAARDAARRASVAVPTSDADAGGRHSAGNRHPGGGSRSRGSGSGSGAEFGVAGQVALARRESPARGSRHLSMAQTLVQSLPHTMAALEAGEISEWRAEIIVREVAVLTPEQQTQVDVELFIRPGAVDDDGQSTVGVLGDRELARRVRAIAYRIDAQSVVHRSRGAVNDRRVTIRPAPDTMCYLTAYLPVAHGVAVHAALTAAAATARAQGDERGKGQLMADTLVERVTGQASAEAVPVEVRVVITDRALFTNAFESGPDSQTPAHIPGYGTVPAAWARNLIRGTTTHLQTAVARTDPAANVTTGAQTGAATASASHDTRTVEQEARAWLRRLYTHPHDGTLVAMESTRRTFTGGLRRFLIARDDTCRTPWCDAPIAHLDHIVPHADGGPTTSANGRGLCARCNYTQQHPGWRSRPETAPPHRWRRHTVTLTTPTGHQYISSAPPLLPGLTLTYRPHDQTDETTDRTDDGTSDTGGGDGGGDGDLGATDMGDRDLGNHDLCADASVRVCRDRSPSHLERYLETLLGAA